MKTTKDLNLKSNDNTAAARPGRLKYRTMATINNGDFATLPILHTVKVSGGKAVSTDLDIQISVPCSLPDGMYHAPGFAQGFFFPCKLPAADFPEMGAPGDVTGQVTLVKAQLKALRWVAMAQSDEETRYYLNGIFFDAAHAVATDGHRLHLIDLPLQWRKDPATAPHLWNSKGQRGAILPKKAVRVMFDLVQEFKTDVVDLVFYEGERFFMRIGQAEVIGKLIDGKFPDWQDVVPKYEPVGETDFDPADFARMMDEFYVMRRINGMERMNGVVIGDGYVRVPEFDKHGEVGRDKRWPCKTKFSVEIGYNSRYLTQTCAGRVTYKDAVEPIKIVGDEINGVRKTALLMPLRA